MHKTSKILQRSVFHSMVVTIIFMLVYLFHNYEIVREGIGDKGFDIVNKYLMHTETTKIANAPSLLLFTYDNEYMLKHQLFDEDNNTNYGNLFHRSRMVDFIQELDIRSERLKYYDRPTPKAFFLDFDVSFTLMPDGKVLSVQDQALIDILKIERDYVIVLPKTQRANFIEQSDDERIQQLIKTKK